jgi:D-alanine-D-alanine ligase
VNVLLLHERLGDEAAIDERDALTQLDFVEGELTASGHRCRRLAIDLDLESARRELMVEPVDLVFNLVESLGGSSRLAHLAPALVEALGLPCSGASSRAFLETTDKLQAKRRLLAAGLPTPVWLEPEHAAIGAPPLRTATVSSGWIVKPIFEDASVDLDDDCVVRDAASARARMAEAPRPSFAEAYVEGREFNLALLEKADGVELLPVAEIRFDAWPEGKPRIVGYAAKWQDESFESRHTPRRFDLPARDADLVARLADLAYRCWELFALAGFARVDFRVDEQGRPFILEVNANPCLSPDAGFAAAAHRAGLSGRDVVKRILAAARPEYALSFASTARRSSVSN